MMGNKLLVLSANTLCSMISSTTDGLALAAIYTIPACGSGPLGHRT